jgi:hypothetical protein
MLAAFGPIAAVPIEPCKLHQFCVHRCKYKCNALSGYEATAVRLRSRRSGSGGARAAAERRELRAVAAVRRSTREPLSLGRNQKILRIGGS